MTNFAAHIVDSARSGAVAEWGTGGGGSVAESNPVFAVLPVGLGTVSGDVTYAVAGQVARGGACRAMQVQFEGGGWGAYRPPPLYIELPGKGHLGRAPGGYKGHPGHV